MFFRARKTQFSENDLAIYTQALERCSDAIVVADADGTILHANAAVLKVLDVRPEEVVGTDLKQWGASMGKEYHEAMWATLMQDKNSFRGEIRGTRKNGDEYVVYVQIIPLLGERKDIQGFLGIEQDITSEQAVVRLRARTGDLNVLNDHLAKEKAESEALLRSIGEGVIATDREGKITFMNQAAQTMLGWRGDEAQGKSIFEVVPVEDENEDPIPQEKRPIVLALKEGQKVVTSPGVNYYFVGQNSKRFPVAITAAPILLGEDVTGVIVVFRDITKEKEVDKMKTEFLSLASHQLRTPLTAIRLFVEMLSNERRGKLNQDQKEYLDNISQSTQRMISLVNDLLNVSRIETGRLKINPKPLDLAFFIEGVIKELDPIVKERSCAILFTKPKKELGSVPIDEGLLREVMRNLLANAIRYSPSKSCTITVRLEKYANMGQENSVAIPEDFRQKWYRGYYLISVTDSGIGIPKNAQSRMFEKFFRADNAIKTEAEGTGLGLYVVKMIMEASGGAIWFESEEGKGTTFYVTIPEEGMRPREGDRGIAA